MTVADLVNRLITAGADAATAAMVVMEAFDLGFNKSAEFRGRSVESPADAAIERRRSADRLRKRAKAAERQTIAEIPQNSAESGLGRCDISSLSLVNGKGNRAESKKDRTEVVAPERAKQASRGTRLDCKSVLADGERQFARDHGLTDRRIDQLWAEFIDYWIGVPGQRGSKTNWPATWRNRVRNVTGTNGAKGSAKDSQPSFYDIAMGK